MDVNNLLAVPAMLLALGMPVVVIVLLLRLSLRRLSGRAGRHDRLLGGIARAGVQASHLEAGTPDVDEIAVPLAPSGRRRHRPHRLSD